MLHCFQKASSASTTQQMPTANYMQLDAEQNASEGSSIWRQVYKTMLCTDLPTGSTCNKGPYCWRDPISSKHYKLHTDKMTRLVEYVEDGNLLNTHDDVPEDVRAQLYVEEQLAGERRPRASKKSALKSPPIPRNMLPAPTSGTPAQYKAPVRKPIPNFNVPGFLDEQVEEYCTWQQSRFKKPHLKAEYQKACNVIIRHGMTLGLILRDPDPMLLTNEGVRRGPAEHFVGDIDYWFKKVKRVRTEEMKE